MNSPFYQLAELPSFELTSTDVEPGSVLSSAQLSGIMGVDGGADVSPQLAWTGFPAETQAFTLTCYDPEAPTGSGFWHWAVANIPATTTSLPADAGNPEEGLLPAEAITVKNDAGQARFIGAAPPTGHGSHRYFFTVHALSQPLDIDESATPAFLGFNVYFNAIARAHFFATYEMPAE